MSRFVDVETVVTVDLGPCQCPVSGLHERDSVDIRRHLSGIDKMAIAMADDSRVQVLRLMNRSIKSWNLVDEAGKPLPSDLAHIERLDDESVRLISDVWAEEAEPLPNESGAPSQDSSPGSASPSRTVQPRTKRR